MFEKTNKSNKRGEVEGADEAYYGDQRVTVVSL